MTETYIIKSVLDASGVQTGIKTIQSSLAKMDSSLPQIGAGLSTSLKSSIGDFKSIGTALGNDLLSGFSTQFGAFGTLASNVASSLGPIGIAGGLAAAGIIAIGTASVQSASHWQTLMTGISKTTGVAGNELDKLSNALQDIMMNTGATADEIANAVITAGSIGIPTNELAEFASTALKMGDAFNMSAEFAANSMGKIGNVVKPAEMSWTEFTKRAGSAVNDLADSMATSEGEILTGMLHLSGTMGLLKPPAETIPSWEALVATIQSLGMTGDHAGEAIKDAMTYAARDSKGALSSLLGVSQTVFQERLRTDAVGTMSDLAKAIAALPIEQQATVLQAFGATGSQAIGLLMGDLDKSTNGFKTLDTAIKTANGAWEEADSLSEAYAKSQQTLNATFSKLTSSISVASAKLGMIFLPAVTSVVAGMAGLVQTIVRVGNAFYTIVTGSQAFTALKETISAFSSVVSTSFGNIVAIVTPAWNAIGGGASVLKVLTAAFDVVTTPITIFLRGLTTVANGLNTVNSAITPVASALGSTFGSAINTASAYVQAFLEVLSDLGPIQSFQNAVDVVKKAWDGLSTVLPQAFSAAFEAVKSLVSQFLTWISDKFGGIFDGVGDQIKTSLENSALGGINSFIGGIQNRANEILNVGKTAGDKIGVGIKTSELADAPGDALKSDKALDGVGEAGKALADKTLSEFAKRAQYSNLADEALLGFINSQSSRSKIRESVYDLYGTTVKYWYDAAEKYPTVYLEVGDVKISAAYDKKKGMATVQDLLSSLGFSDDIINGLSSQQSAKMENAIQKIKDAAAAEAKKKQDLEFGFDITETQKQIDDWSPSVQTRINSFFKSLALTIENNDGLNSAFTKKIKSAGQDLNTALSDISLEGLAELDTKWNAAFKSIGTNWSGSLGDIARDSIAEYQKELLAGIADTGTFVNSEMARIGESARSALEDGFISEDDRSLFNALGGQIDTLKRLFPAEMGDATNDTISEMVRLINAGKIQEAFALIGKESGEEFSENLLGGANLDVTLQKLAADPDTYKEYITNPMMFAFTEGLEGIKSQVADAQDAFESGIDPKKVYDSYIAPFDKVAGYIPGWATTLKQQLAAGRISFEQFFSYFDYYSSKTGELNSAMQQASNGINSMGTTAKSNSANIIYMGNSAASTTGQLQSMGLAISPLNAISGKGISVSFSPAKVVADEASATLTRDFATFGDYITQFGTATNNLASFVTTGLPNVLNLGSGYKTLGGQSWSANVESVTAESDGIECACGEAFITAAKASTGPQATVSPFYSSEELAKARQTAGQINLDYTTTANQINAKNTGTWLNINSQQLSTNAVVAQTNKASSINFANTMMNAGISYQNLMTTIGASNVSNAEIVSAIYTTAANQSAAIGLNAWNQGAYVFNGASNNINTVSSGFLSNGGTVNTGLASNASALENSASSLNQASASLSYASNSIFVTSSNIIGLANRGGGTAWGGTSISGGGAWIGTGSTAVGGRGYVSWGGTAASIALASSGYTGAVRIGRYARGGNPTAPTLALMAEKGEEMILPHDITVGLKNLIATGSVGKQVIQLPKIEPADIIIDGRKIGEVAFKYGTVGIQTKGNFSIR